MAKPDWLNPSHVDIMQVYRPKRYRCLYSMLVGKLWVSIRASIERNPQGAGKDVKGAYVCTGEVRQLGDRLHTERCKVTEWP